jgi:hypothetical protein
MPRLQKTLRQIWSGAGSAEFTDPFRRRRPVSLGGALDGPIEGSNAVMKFGAKRGGGFTPPG